MARAPGLSSLGLNPFGTGGSSFDAFSLGQSRQERAYLAFRKVEVEWEAGRITDTAYLASLREYAGKLKVNSSERVGADARVEQMTYRFERNALEVAVRNGTKTKDELLAYDLSKLTGLNTESEEYQQRLSLVNSTQNDIFNDMQEVVQERWSDGKMTSAQLLTWYKGLRLDLLNDNPDLKEIVDKAVADLDDRVVDERDSRMLQDYSEGKIGPSEFLTYATAAQNRYEAGTQQYDDWDDRIEGAKEQAVEDSILYRYNLTQRYQQLQKFVKDHGTAPTGHTTSGRKGTTTTRVVWDGSKWVTKKTTTGATAGGYVGPTAAQQKAWKELQIEVADAKKEMAQIASKVGKQAGGWVTTDDAIAYYKKVGSKFAVGSAEWYAVQGKLDGLNQQKHAEAVLKKQGIKISYPKVKSEGKEYGSGGKGVFGTVEDGGVIGPSVVGTSQVAGGGGGGSSGGGGGGGGVSSTSKSATKASSGSYSPSKASGDRTLTIDEFMKGIARVESGGRYDAVNKSSGAYGKYQIMPASWKGWARKYLGDENAKPTPENQEKVARTHMLAMYKQLGDWRAVAHAWLTGDYTKDPSKWSTSSQKYVNKVFGGLGMSPTKVVKMTPKDTAPSAGDKSTGPKPVKISDPGDGRRNVLDFPRGYDGRAYENFYQRFTDAWKSGEETFTDYSSGKAVSYFIPLDPDERLALMEEMDDRRVDYFGAKAEAYLNPNGVPTATSLAAVRQANGAIIDSVENKVLAMSFKKDPKAEVVSENRQSKTTASRADARHNEDTGESQNVTALSATNPNVVNPLAKGITLSEKLDAQLANVAKAAKRAYDSGNFELAYSLNQTAIRLVETAKPALDNYLELAGGGIKTVRSLGGVVPGSATSDFGTLDEQVGQLTKGTDPSLKLLDEVQSDLEKIYQTDNTGEPIRRGGEFVLKENVSLTWKGGKLNIDTTATKDVGWSTPTTKSSKNNTVTLGGVKSGTSIKGNVQAEYEVGVVGFVAGNENYPVYGKIVSGIDQNGKPYQWAEDPINGGWYTIGKEPLNIKAPKGFAAVTGEGGSGAMDFSFSSGGTNLRLVLDEKDGKYVVYENSGGPMGTGEWTPVGKTGGGKNNDLGTLLKEAGWGVDTTRRSGDDRVFSNYSYPIVGVTATEWEDYLKNTGGKTTSTTRSLKGPVTGISGGNPKNPVTGKPKVQGPTQTAAKGYYGATDRITPEEASYISRSTGTKVVQGSLTKATEAKISANEAADRAAESKYLFQSTVRKGVSPPPTTKPKTTVKKKTTTKAKAPASTLRKKSITKKVVAKAPSTKPKVQASVARSTTRGVS